MNLVLVDWGKLSGAYATILEYFVAETIRDFPLYQMAIWNVDVVGERIAQFLIFLQERMRFRGRIHLIGHSLGAHISGVAGRYVYDLTSRMLDRITGNLTSNLDKILDFKVSLLDFRDRSCWASLLLQ